jgi:hypothetical protein
MKNAAVANPSLRPRIVCIPVISASASNLKPATYFLIESLPMKRLTQFAPRAEIQVGKPAVSGSAEGDGQQDLKNSAGECRLVSSMNPQSRLGSAEGGLFSKRRLWRIKQPAGGTRFGYSVKRLSKGFLQSVPNRVSDEEDHAIAAPNRAAHLSELFTLYALSLSLSLSLSLDKHLNKKRKKMI